MDIYAEALKQANQFPQAKVSQTFEALRTELVTVAGSGAARQHAAAGLLAAYNELLGMRATIKGEVAPPVLSDLAQVPTGEKVAVLVPALDAAAQAAIGRAIEMYGATDDLRRALTNIQAAYGVIAGLLS
jgi:hypothetical protein